MEVDFHFNSNPINIANSTDSYRFYNLDYKIQKDMNNNFNDNFTEHFNDMNMNSQHCYLWQKSSSTMKPAISPIKVSSFRT